MAISPLEARVAKAQLREADGLEENVEDFLRNWPEEARTNRGLEFAFGDCCLEIVNIVIERFRRTGWHVVADLDTGRLIFNDATPEF